MSMMGELKFFLGLQIKQDNKSIYIHQQNYTKELLKKFKMEDAKLMKTPMHASNLLSKDESGKPIGETIYRGMIGTFLYLTLSRPDIMHSICLCVRFQFDPRESHLKAIKRNLRYLVGTTNQCLFYKKNQDFMLVGYLLADQGVAQFSICLCILILVLIRYNDTINCCYQF